MEFEASLRSAREWVDARYLERRAAFGWSERLAKQIDHVFLGAGKAFRPALLFWTRAQLEGDFSRPPAPIVDAALALEFVHTYSLVHDDLPAMDNDDFRRGKPTLHRLYGEADAILAGDALLTAAFEIIATSGGSAEWKVAVLARLARAAGGAGMIEGQLLDIHGDSEDLERLHRRKTGDLIACAVEVGALSSSVGSASPTSDFVSLGSDLGLYFQIVDDLLDDAEGTGKTAGKDARSGKKTFAADPLAARRRLAELAGATQSTSLRLGFRSGAIDSLLFFLSSRKS